MLTTLHRSSMTAVARAVPSDLREPMDDLGVTGGITASGGAWNAGSP
ncbi:hypothetical protein [Streptomyces sp. STR69]|nr:hypothetical protein [Streptomyces sp. STR69]